MTIQSNEGDFAFCAVLSELMDKRSVQGRSGKLFEGLGALSTRNNLMTLRALHLALKPMRTLEIGLCFGGSCLVFTASYRDIGAIPAKQHVAIDPFQRKVWDDSGLLSVERAGLADYLDFRPAFSSVELARMVERGDQFDIVYIDGSHLFEDVFVDFYFVSRLLAESGLAVFDDSNDPHVRKVLRFIRSNLSSSFAEVDLAPYRCDQGRSVRFRVARIFGRNQMTVFRRVGAASREWNARFANF
jgi:cephalosporin hydroxylase